MDKSKAAEQPKKCFCARCFMPIEEGDKVDIEGQIFHRMCGTCCICRTVPKSLKMFYGHVFCAECFKNHVLNRFKGEHPCSHINNWWMQSASSTEPQDTTEKKGDQSTDGTPKPEPKCSCCASKSGDSPKRCFCARCLQGCDEKCKVDIDGQSFHPQCAHCYFCHCVPKNKVKIYFGKVFCEECFNRNILGKNKDNPNEFFKTCMEQWQNNPQFGDNLKQFMSASSSGNKLQSPFVIIAGHPPHCRCGGSHASHEWSNQSNEPRKCA